MGDGGLQLLSREAAKSALQEDRRMSKGCRDLPAQPPSLPDVAGWDPCSFDALTNVF